MLRLLLPLLLAATAAAQDTLIREVFDTATDTHVEVLALFSKPSAGGGYLPVRVKIANNLTVSRTAILSFESYSDRQTGLRTASRFSFTAAPGQTLTRDILVPQCPSLDSYSPATLQTSLNGSLGSGENYLTSLPDPSQPSVLLSDSLFTPNASALDAAVTSTGRSRSEFAARFDPGQLPDSWLAFSGYDCLMLTDAEWTGSPASARNAILSWTRLGGHLVIFATGTTTRSSLSLPSDTSFGKISVETIGSDLKLDATATVKLAGKGPVRSRSSSVDHDYASSWPLQLRFGSQTFHYGLFISVLVIFAIIVGPINLFVFAKPGQRHRLFITTPLISLAASLLLIILILVQDGFGGSGIRRVLMEVRPDGGENAAYLHQEQFCRTGVLTGSRFTLTDPAIINPVAIAPSRWARFSNSYEKKGAFHLQPDAGTIAASGEWFQSRSEHGHTLSTILSTRGRIEPSSGETFTSTFDFPIASLYYLSPQREWFTAEKIETGKPFRMTRVDSAIVETKLSEEKKSFAPRQGEMLMRTSRRPGGFVAFTTAAPGVQTHTGIHWKETQTVITGPILTP